MYNLCGISYYFFKLGDFRGDEANTRDWKGSDICVNFLAETGMDWEELGLYFFKQYMKIVSGYGFNIDGWEEVWEFEIKDEETGRGTGLYDIHDPSGQRSLFNAKYTFEMPIRPNKNS